MMMIQENVSQPEKKWNFVSWINRTEQKHSSLDPGLWVKDEMLNFY